MPDLFQTHRMELLFPALPMAQLLYRLMRIYQLCLISGYVDNFEKIILPRTLRLAGCLNRIIDMKPYILLDVGLSCFFYFILSDTSTRPPAGQYPRHTSCKA